MEQRDLLKEQIEQMGKVLAKNLSDFLGLKSNNNAAQGIEISNKCLKNELDLDIEKIIALNKAELKNYVLNFGLIESHLEILSEYLKEIGIEKVENNKGMAELYLQKAIELLDIADEITKTMSFDRINRKNKIEKFL